MGDDLGLTVGLDGLGRRVGVCFLLMEDSLWWLVGWNDSRWGDGVCLLIDGLILIYFGNFLDIVGAIDL